MVTAPRSHRTVVAGGWVAAQPTIDTTNRSVGSSHVDNNQAHEVNAVRHCFPIPVRCGLETWRMMVAFIVVDGLSRRRWFWFGVVVADLSMNPII
jgi:hypothetical protein